MYAFELDPKLPVKTLEKNLKQSILESYRLLHFLFHNVVEITQYTQTDEQLRKTQHIPRNDYALPTRLLDNPYLKFIGADASFNRFLKTQKLNESSDREVTRLAYRGFVKRDDCLNYLTSESDLESERGVLLSLLGFILKQPGFQQLMEDQFPSWSLDKQSCQKSFRGHLDKITTALENKKKPSLELSATMDDELKFAKELLGSTLDNHGLTGKLIDKKLQHWDLERVSKLDLLLMRMALGELMHFSSIPVKVTLNEYIDISKIYSTPKSHEFINGILDKILKTLQKSGEIQKTGRGLK